MGRFGGVMAAVALAALAPGCGLLGRGVVETPEAAALRTEEEGRIRAEVVARLAHEPSLDATALRVVVAGTDVHLHGGVEGYAALRCALATAGLVRGVSLVVDYMVIHPGPTEAVCLAPRVFPAAADAR